jgi:Protein phosphatase 2C
MTVWDRSVHPPFPSGNFIGEPGRQGEVVPAVGPLTVGVADTELDFATVDPFVMRACATRGLTHRHSGIPRQDAFAVAADEDHLVIAVADGVSQGEWSHVAAVTAARATCKLALDHAARDHPIDWSVLSRRVSLRIVEEAEYRRLVAAPPRAAVAPGNAAAAGEAADAQGHGDADPAAADAQEHGDADPAATRDAEADRRDRADPAATYEADAAAPGNSDAADPDAHLAPAGVDDIDERLARCRRVMSCTLVVAVLDRYPDEYGRLPVELAVLAGDSGAYRIDDGGLWLVAGGKDDGDSPVTSTAVRPLPGRVTPAAMAFDLEEGQGLVLVTDGLGDPLGDGDSEVGRELARRWRQPPTIDRFLLDVNFLRRTFDDDRTAVAVWQLPREPLPREPEAEVR